jgi:molybdate transport system substrate-binding protein
MAKLRVLSAGAAQAVTERIIEGFKRDTGSDVAAEFGAVGAMRAKILAGEKVDVILLTRAMIDELAAAKLVEPHSRVDLGRVGTGVAVHAGTARPDVSDANRLRGVILAAATIVCPDPEIATAGKVVMALMHKLGVAADVQSRLRFFPNGYAAMRWLAASGGADAIGITQVTEILPNSGVAYAGPLPEEFQMKTVYAAGLACSAAEPSLARGFLQRYQGDAARALLREAGYELG